jgi:hypothetical protein
VEQLVIVKILINYKLVDTQNEMGWVCGAYGGGVRGAQGVGRET